MSPSALALVLMLFAASLPPQDLRFRDLFQAGPRELRPSERLLSLEGRRVRIVGFMADAEDPPMGGFYLCPFPLVVTESGAGTGDLPPQTVFVVVRSARGQALEHRPGPLEVTGVLELGGGGAEPWPIRVVLDPPSSTAGAAGPGEPATSRP